MYYRQAITMAGLGLTLALGTLAAAHAAPVFSNNGPPGDSFTNATTTNQGQAVGTSGWYYNNVRNSGVVGINNTYPQSGNGSAYLETQLGPGGSSSKADIEFLANAVADANGNWFANGTLGQFSNLASMAYDWYRDSSSTNSAVQHPVLRVLLDADGNLTTTNDRGGLVFERAYNSPSTVPTDTWVTDTINAGTNLWNFGLGLGFAFDIDSSSSPYDDDLAQWQAYAPLSNAIILGFSSGVGSGWGPFKGAADNISWTISGVTSSSNFEVRGTVPVPPTLALLALGLAALGSSRRRTS
jgi:hypothetical protein